MAWVCSGFLCANCVQAEQEEKERRKKEKAEAHLYTLVRCQPAWALSKGGLHSLLA